MLQWTFKKIAELLYFISDTVPSYEIQVACFEKNRKEFKGYLISI